MPFVILKIVAAFAVGYVAGNPAIIETIKSKIVSKKKED